MRIQKTGLSAVTAAMTLLAVGCGAKMPAPDTGKVVAADNQIDAVIEGRVPVYGKELKSGVYPVKVDSSSSMFRITACELTVKDGAMRAVMTMGGTGYLKLYMGTGEDAGGCGYDCHERAPRD